MYLTKHQQASYDYLNRIRTMNEAINAKIDERNDLMLMCTTTGSFDYSAERVQSSKPLEARFTITLEKYFEVEQKINEQIDRYVDTKNEITSQIGMLHDHEHIRILKYAFIDGKSISEILKIRNWKYKTSKTYDLYGEALDEFYDVILKNGT